MTELLLWLMLALPAPAYVEQGEDQAERFGTIALATESATELDAWGWPYSREELATAALAVSWHESGRWAPSVHSGRRKGDNGRSHCLGGIMRGTGWITEDEWKRAVGTGLEPTTVCMRLTTRILARHAGRCFGRNPGKLDGWKMGVLFYAYGSGKGCTRKPPKWAQSRAWTWTILERRRRGE